MQGQLAGQNSPPCSQAEGTAGKGLCREWPGMWEGSKEPLPAMRLTGKNVDSTEKEPLQR